VKNGCSEARKLTRTEPAKAQDTHCCRYRWCVQRRTTLSYLRRKGRDESHGGGRRSGGGRLSNPKSKEVQGNRKGGGRMTPECPKSITTVTSQRGKREKRVLKLTEKPYSYDRKKLGVQRGSTNGKGMNMKGAEESGER